MINSNKHQSLYDYLINKTNGNLTKHTINYQLSKLKPNAKIYAESLEVSGCLVSCTKPEETRNGILLAGTVKHFNHQDIQLVTSAIYGVDNDSVSFSKFLDEKNNDYYSSDESGMYLEPKVIRLHYLKICIGQTQQHLRIEKVFDFFEKHRNRLGSNLSNQEIYELIGSPTKNALWKEWYRLYPTTFTPKCQPKFFENGGLSSVTLKSGNDKVRNKIPEEHQL